MMQLTIPSMMCIGTTILDNGMAVRRAGALTPKISSGLSFSPAGGMRNERLGLRKTSITFVTSGATDDEARELLRMFGMPFRRKEAAGAA